MRLFLAVIVLIFFSGRLLLLFLCFVFAVVLLELVMGKKAIDQRRDKDEQNLIAWVRNF